MTSNFARAMFDDWSAKHRAIKHTECPAVQDINKQRKKNGPPLCSDVGMCFHTVHGIMVYGMRNWYIKHQKAIIKSGLIYLKLLIGGDIIVRHRGVRVEIGEGPWASALSDVMGGDTRADDEVVWWQISHQNQSPYKGKYRVCRMAAVQNPLVEEEIQLEANRER